jgi:hypothetical protein
VPKPINGQQEVSPKVPFEKMETRNKIAEPSLEIINSVFEEGLGTPEK